jgi:four helix bundle protein
MQKSGTDLGIRLIRFAASVIKMLAYRESGKAFKHISDQLLRSATSVGANYEEARAAESTADFIHKMQISLKEMRESYYWLAVSIEGGIVTGDQSHSLFDEARQLRAILSKAVATAKANNKKG